MILCDSEIRHRIEHSGMIRNALLDQVRRNHFQKTISAGVSSYGYDARLAPEYRVFTNVNNTIVDPKNFSKDVYVEKTGDTCIIPPMSFILARTIEEFCIPRDVLALCVGKSSLARCGIFLNTTPLEPEWGGTITLEIFNATALPARIYANEGICQVIFFSQALRNPGEPTLCETSYKDRDGKYMGQRGITLPKM